MSLLLLKLLFPNNILDSVLIFLNIELSWLLIFPNKEPLLLPSNKLNCFISSPLLLFPKLKSLLLPPNIVDCAPNKLFPFLFKFPKRLVP